MSLDRLAEMIWPRENYFVAVFCGTTEAVLNDVDRALAAQARLLAVPAGPGKGEVRIAPEGKEARLLEALAYHASGDIPFTASDEDVSHHARMAFERAIQTVDGVQGAFSVAGAMRRVVDHFVLPIVRVNRAALEATPRLTRDLVGDSARAPKGFVESVIECLLGNASNELARERPGELTTWVQRDYQALLRLAASLFLDRVALSTQNESALGGLLDRINAIAVLPYEGSPARGRLVLASREHPSLRRTVAFRDGISLRDPRAARKALQIVSELGLLWCSGEVFIGLAKNAAKYDATREDRFEVAFTGAARWQLLHGGRPLLEVEHGAPRLPRPRVDQAAFAVRVRARLPGASVEPLWAVVQAAQEQKHGTMVVITGEAGAEAERLAPQLLRIEPQLLDEFATMQLSAIDGALILDVEGRCHAFGAILDGTALPGRGTLSRGARHNSAIRYTDSHSQAVAVVVSEDGDVSVFGDPPQA